MTPIEKAKDLYNKFYNYESHPVSVMVRNDVAKTSSLICADEIIENTPHWSDCTINGEPAISKGQCDCKQGEYWEKVKEEIKKIKPTR